MGGGRGGIISDIPTSRMLKRPRGRMVLPRRNTYEGGCGDSFIRNAYLLSYRIGRYPIIGKKDKNGKSINSMDRGATFTRKGKLTRRTRLPRLTTLTMLTRIN